MAVRLISTVSTESARNLAGIVDTLAIDKAGIKINSNEAFIELLKSFGEVEHLHYNHVHVGFAILDTPAVMINFLRYYSSSLEILVSKNVLLATGSLAQWKNIIVNSEIHHSVEIRKILNEIFEILCRIGYRRVFNNYVTKDLYDGSYQLTKV